MNSNMFLDEFWSTPVVRSFRNTEAGWSPACDVEENQDHYLLTLDVPGIQKDQIKIEVVDNQLTISGERRQDHQKKSDGAWYSERRLGSFSRSFALPQGADLDKIEANCQDGLLRIYVPKAESTKPRQIKITNGSGVGFFGRLIGQSAHEVDKEKAAS